MDQTLDRVSAIVQDKATSHVNTSMSNKFERSQADMTGFKLCRSKSANACTVSCREPSPVIRTPLLYLPVSFMAWNVPTAAPVA